RSAAIAHVVARPRAAGFSDARTRQRRARMGGAVGAERYGRGDGGDHPILDDRGRSVSSFRGTDTAAAARWAPPGVWRTRAPRELRSRAVRRRNQPAISLRHDFHTDLVLRL